MEYKIFKNVQKANKEGGEVIIEKNFKIRIHNKIFL